VGKILKKLYSNTHPEKFFDLNKYFFAIRLKKKNVFDLKK